MTAESEIDQMPQTKPANFALARQAVMMAYALLAPDDLTTTDLNQHLVSIHKAERERVAGKRVFTGAQAFGSKEIESFELRLQRLLFFEAFVALDHGLNGRWFQWGS